MAFLADGRLGDGRQVDGGDGGSVRRARQPVRRHARHLRRRHKLPTRHVNGVICSLSAPVSSHWVARALY